MEKEESVKEKRQLPELFEKVWGQALLAVSTAEEEASRVVGKLADVAGWSQDEVKRQAKELGERLASQRRDIERSVEEGVKRALQKLRVPRREEVAALNARVEQLSKRVEALGQK
ncbi:MAG: phasin family protein [Myxococcales bacterium]|nr:phasin family protein [Myxococcales bacterium]